MITNPPRNPGSDWRWGSCRYVDQKMNPAIDGAWKCRRKDRDYHVERAGEVYFMKKDEKRGD